MVLTCRDNEESSSVLLLKGENVASSFRHQQRLHQLQALDPSCTDYSAYYIYFIASNKTLSAASVATLSELLQATATIHFSDIAEPFALVVPRFGTISPWSSKATEIAKICDIAGLVRLERGIIYQFKQKIDLAKLKNCLHDPLTESWVTDTQLLDQLFLQSSAISYQTIPLLKDGLNALDQADVQLGLALSGDEKKYLLKQYQQLQRDPTDVELMMFAQVNSEHCRHKIFNAQWKIDGQPQKSTLFQMIRNTHDAHPDAVLSAYSDNAAVMKGLDSSIFYADPLTHIYQQRSAAAPFVLKVETHNHPTAISPFPGAATGSGGEIRDEAATGRGAKTKIGMTGFSVSHLHIPHYAMPWEVCVGKAPHMASALEIMLQAPVGGAAFNNEFGRPNVCGYFRSFEMVLPSTYGEVTWGYHKPIMLAGGVGQIHAEHVQKQSFSAGTKLIILGGPAMAIGLGGGAASSRASHSEQSELDFASVQRANPEMQRRAYEVIQTCCAMGADNPILSVHDVGAGGLSNALPELVEAVNCGALFQLRDIPNAEPAMSPLAIWCNEAQERFVLAIAADKVALLAKIAQRERALFAVVGEVTSDPTLIVADSQFNNQPVAMPCETLFEKLPKIRCEDQRAAPPQQTETTHIIDLVDAIERVLQFPAVANKSFLITIGDRSVGGLVVREQMIGPWQIPVADVAVCANNFSDKKGQALAVGERAPIALLHPAASARMAVGEAITNLAAADVSSTEQIVLSANWMAAPHHPGEGAALYDAVAAIGETFCPALGIAIPVGKDSLSMQARWQDNLQEKCVTSPVSVVITAAANVSDIRKTLTPQLQHVASKLLLLDLGEGANALGGSVLLQTHNMIGNQPADCGNPQLLQRFFTAMYELKQQNLVLAYHDRADGGLLATICEMQFCSRLGVALDITHVDDDAIKALFSEELGAVLQVATEKRTAVNHIMQQHQLEHCVIEIGEVSEDDALTITHQKQQIYHNTRVALQTLWSKPSYHLQKMRDNPHCVEQEFSLIAQNNSGLHSTLSFVLDDQIAAPYINKKVKPKVAILREQGVNGHVEMAAAFTHAGFEAIDVHMSDLLSGEKNMQAFDALAACGGFSYGDVLGAGRGWAQSILLHDKVRQQFETFFARPTIALGVCNGCQMFAELKTIIPGAQQWPRLKRNLSEQFEARLVPVKIMTSPSLLMNTMHDSIMPVVVSHGEGLMQFASATDLEFVEKNKLVVMRYVDYAGNTTQHYPLNPNGSAHGIAGLTTADGRVTMLMPHPERVFLNQQLSYREFDQHYSAWFQLFVNARRFFS